MRKRPWILVVLALVHIVAPIGNLIINAHWARVPFFHYVHLFFQPANFAKQWIHVVIPILAGIAIYLCRRWSFWFYLLCMCTLFVASYLGYQQRVGSVSLLGLISVFVINIVLVGYFLVPAVRQVYLDPRLRWWQTKPRYRADIPAQFSEIEGEATLEPGQVINFSEGGLFIKARHLPDDHSVIRVQFHYDNADYEFKGTVIHHQHRKAMGFGVQFLEDGEEKSAAKQVTHSLHANGLLMVDRQYSADDDFTVWLKRLVKTGKGLLPEFTKKS
jgi:hypothetical protein